MAESIEEFLGKTEAGGASWTATAADMTDLGPLTWAGPGFDVRGSEALRVSFRMVGGDRLRGQQKSVHGQHTLKKTPCSHQGTGSIFTNLVVRNSGLGSLDESL